VSLERFVRWVMRDTRYHRLYAASVELDHGNDTFDVRLDDPEMAGQGFVRVPVAYGLAGSSSRVARGGCLLGFNGGDPKQPRIKAWAFEVGSAVVKLAGGEASVARKGDLIRISVGPGPIPVSGIAAGDVTNPSPPPPTVPLPPAAQFIGVAVVAEPVYGKIIAGARRVKA